MQIKEKGVKRFVYTMKKEDFVSAHSTKVEIGTAKMRNNKPFAVKYE